MLFCSNKCALKHLFWINSSFCKCRLFSWSIKIYLFYQQHGICQVHFLLKLSNLWHYLHSSVRVNTIMSQLHPFHMPRKNVQRNTLCFPPISSASWVWIFSEVSTKTYSCCLSHMKQPIQIWLYYYLQHKAPLSFSPKVRCFISTMILYLWKMQYMKTVT